MRRSTRPILALRPHRAGADPARRPRRLRRSPCAAAGEAGQAAAELIALLPLLAGLLVLGWQFVLAGHAVWAAAAAARAAARAEAIGLDPEAAARAHLPARLERGLRVRPDDDGEVAIAVRIPTLPGIPPLGRTTATARFDPQR